MKFEERLKKVFEAQENKFIEELDEAEKVIYLLKKFFQKELLYLLEEVKGIFVIGDECIDVYDSHDEETGEIVLVGKLEWNSLSVMDGYLKTVKYKSLKIILKRDDTIEIYGGKNEKIPFLKINWRLNNCRDKIEDAIISMMASKGHQYIDPNISEKTIIKEEKRLVKPVYDW